jgi:sulfatase maturation enzyme AslB (radical SAM superfamily)
MGDLCNQRCSFCYQDDHSAKNMIDETIWREKLLPIYGNLETILLIGGEPTIMPNARSLAQLIWEQYPLVQFEMITNAKVFDPFWKKIFLERGKKLVFSANAATQQTYDRIVTRGDWQAVLRNITEIAGSRKGANPGLQLHASFVITTENYHELIPFIDLCRHLGLERAIFMLDFVRGSDSMQESLKTVVEQALLYVRDVSDLEIFGLEEVFCRLQPESAPVLSGATDANYNNKICPIPWNSLNVNAMGDVSFCCAAWLPLGNLHKQSIEMLWNSRVAREMRKEITAGNYRMCKKSCAINCNPARNPERNNNLFLRRVFYFFQNHPKEMMKTVRTRLSSMHAFKRS